SDDVAEEVGRGGIVPAEARPHLVLVDDAVVDGFDHPLLTERDGGEWISVDQVPSWLAALELSRNRAFGRAGAVLLDHNARRLLERLAIGRIVGLDRISAPVDKHKLSAVGRRAARSKCERRSGEEEGRELREAAAADLAAGELLRQDMETVLLLAGVVLMALHGSLSLLIVVDVIPLPARGAGPAAGSPGPSAR